MTGVMVVKIGGATLGSHDTTIEDIAELQRRGRPLVVVHGGGKVITDWLSRQGISTRFVDGERVTDRAVLDVVAAVLGGLVNKDIVATINNLGGRAVGITGVDGGLIQGRVKKGDMGYMGAIVKVDASLLEVLLRAGYVPVVAPLSLYALDRPDDAPPMLNINGDPVAGEIAAAIGAERLIFLTDVPGIGDGSGKVLPRLTPDEAEALVASGVASGGMIPKIRACIRALSAASIARIVDGRKPHALLEEIEGGGSEGTTIEKER
ncbi:MAG: acetylglutamate kinase [Chloroflexi bacterium]|nr:acetylglutamate kinase [Chloroflexota bacterium]